MYMLFFFYKQKTAYDMRISDWSSDVCSSDLRHREFVMGSGDMSADELLRFFVGFNKAMVAHLGAGAVIYEVIDWRSLHSLLDATRDILGPLANMAVWAKDRPGQGSFLRSQHELILIFKIKGKMRNNVKIGRAHV